MFWLPSTRSEPLVIAALRELAAARPGANFLGE